MKNQLSSGFFGRARKILVMLIAVALLVNTLIVAAPGGAFTAYAEEGSAVTVRNDDGSTVVEYGKLQYSLQSDGAVVTGCADTLSGVVEIPAAVNGVPVTAIGDHAFAGQSGITELRLPETITAIGNCAFFGCSQLSSINIPDAVTSTGVDAFAGCPTIIISNESEDGLVTAIAGAPGVCVGSQQGGELVEGTSPVYNAYGEDWHVDYSIELLTR